MQARLPITACVLGAIFATSHASACTDGEPAIVQLCDLLASPAAFADRTVDIEADFATDGVTYGTSGSAGCTPPQKSIGLASQNAAPNQALAEFNRLLPRAHEYADDQLCIDGPVKLGIRLHGRPTQSETTGNWTIEVEKFVSVRTIERSHVCDKVMNQSPVPVNTE